MNFPKTINFLRDAMVATAVAMILIYLIFTIWYAQIATADEIAAITAEGTTVRSVDAEVLAALKAKARAVGGHAIIGYTQGSRAASTASGETSDVHVRSGTAIRFRSEDCMK